jgi:hypothetical protein
MTFYYEVQYLEKKNVFATHIRGFRRAVSEWLRAYPRQLIIQLDSAFPDLLRRGVRSIPPYFPITQPGISNLLPLHFLIIEGGYFFLSLFC